MIGPCVSKAEECVSTIGPCVSKAEECVSTIGPCVSKAEECVSMIGDCASKAEECVSMATDRPSSSDEPSAKTEKHSSRRIDCLIKLARCPTSTAESSAFQSKPLVSGENGLSRHGRNSSTFTTR